MPGLSLYCDAWREKYILHIEGVGEVYSFASPEDAIQHASALVNEKTPLAICDANGRILITATVLPATSAGGRFG
jgi:hypothetical protein